MKTKPLKKIWVAAVIISLLVVGGAVIVWAKRPAIERTLEQASLPAAATYEPSPAAATPAATPSPKTSPATSPIESVEAATTGKLPAQANLAVPFTVQAPHAIWSDPYGEFCEEASVYMAISYIQHKKIPDADTAERELLAIKAFEEKHFGYYKDTNAAETATIFQEYYKYDKVHLLQNPTVNDIKQAVASGKLVLVPAAGRDLGNPYFQSPGPLYHMVVIKGYTTANKFIVNDPGTRHGADYLYSQDTIMSAMHDWRSDGDIEKGKKVVLIVG